jgi:hypothetical protein
MEGLAVSLTLFGFLLFGSPTDHAIMRKAQGKVGGQYVTAPLYEGLHIYHQGSRWTVCGQSSGHQITGRSGAERFIVDKKSLIFSGDPAFNHTADDKDAFEALWRTRCVKA